MWRGSLCFLLLLFSMCALAQDTIYVYETVYEIDTIWLEESHPDVSLNQLKGFENNVSLLNFHSAQIATIPEKRIYDYGNHLNKTKMKKAGFFSFMFMAIQGLSFGQKDINSIYNVGIGLANENNISNYGIVFSNDYKKYLTNRIAINPRLSFFQSTGSFEPAKQYGYRSHSGLMLDLGLNLDIIRRNAKMLSLVVGPTYEVGSDTYRSVGLYVGGNLIEEKFTNTQLNRYGLFADLEYCFYKNDKWAHSIAIRTNYFDAIYPEYLGVVYKIGLVKRNN